MYTKELDVRNVRISNLESSVKALSGEKDEIFDQLQLRQAELESSQSHLESLQSQCAELQHQLREANDRIGLLNEELIEMRQEQEIQVRSPGGSSAEEVSRMLAAAETKYETRISELRRRLSIVERERDEGEADWSRKLLEKSKEVEALKNVLNRSSRSQEEEEEGLNKLKEDLQELREQNTVLQTRVSDLLSRIENMTETEVSTYSGATL